VKTLRGCIYDLTEGDTLNDPHEIIKRDSFDLRSEAQDSIFKVFAQLKELLENTTVDDQIRILKDTSSFLDKIKEGC